MIISTYVILQQPKKPYTSVRAIRSIVKVTRAGHCLSKDTARLCSTCVKSYWFTDSILSPVCKTVTAGPLGDILVTKIPYKEIRKLRRVGKSLVAKEYMSENSPLLDLIADSANCSLKLG